MKKQLLLLLCLSLLLSAGCGGAAKKTSDEESTETEQNEEKEPFRMSPDRPMNILSDYAPQAADSVSMFALLYAAREKQNVKYITPHTTENTKIIDVEQITMLKYTNFHDGVAAVMNGKTKKWGVIDRQGNLIIDFCIGTTVQGDIPVFHNGVALIDGAANGYQRGKLLINKQAEIVKELPELQFCTNFVGGVATGFMRLPDPAKSTPQNEVMSVYNVYLNTQGELVFPEISQELPDYSIYNFLTLEKPRPLRDGLAAFYDYRTQHWGFINEYGQIEIGAIFKKAQDFSEGVAAVMDNDDKWWFIQPDGNLAFEQSFHTEPEPFQEGVSIVRKRGVDNPIAYIDKTGKILYDNMLTASSFMAGNAIIMQKGLFLLNRDMETKKEIFSFNSPDFYDSGLLYSRERIISPDNNEVLLSGCREHYQEGLAKCYYLYKPEGMTDGKHASGFMNIEGEIEILFMEPLF